MKIKKIIAYSLLFTGINFLTACSLVYDLAQENAQENCKKIFDRHQREECLKKYNMSYEQYDKMRTELQQKPIGER